MEARIAMTLREVCALTTEEIATAFLTSTPTLAKRIVRAKEKIREEHVPYEVPSRTELPARLEAVLLVIYLVFNEGYSASSGASLTRPDLSREAIRLGRLLVEMLPESEAIGLLALMLLQESRRQARSSPEGDLILLDAQDRSLWNRELIREGAAMVHRAMTERPGPYALQAAIAAVHAGAPSAGETDWARIVTIYDALASVDRSPVIEMKTSAEWNTSVVSNRIVETLTELKNRSGKNMAVFGGPTIVSTLVQAGLVDEYRLFIHPIAVRGGFSPFGTGPDKLKLALISTRQFSNGVIAVHYSGAP